MRNLGNASRSTRVYVGGVVPNRGGTDQSTLPSVNGGWVWGRRISVGDNPRTCSRVKQYPEGRVEPFIDRLAVIGDPVSCVGSSGVRSDGT